MEKDVGFSQKIHLSWLDATAAFCAETSDPAELRARLEPIVAESVAGSVVRRKTIDVLLNIWLKSGEVDDTLRQTAVHWFQTSPAPGDRLWLHYGLTLLYYPFFRECTTVIGQLSRSEESLTKIVVLKRLAARLGDLGSLERALRRVLASLRNWEVLLPAPERHTYRPQRQAFPASQPALETWLLTCALKAHPVEEIHFSDLLHLPALFPFRFTLTAHDLRQAPQFEVQRQGLGFDMVRLGN